MRLPSLSRSGSSVGGSECTPCSHASVRHTPCAKSSSVTGALSRLDPEPRPLIRCRQFVVGGDAQRNPALRPHQLPRRRFRPACHRRPLARDDPPQRGQLTPRMQRVQLRRQPVRSPVQVDNATVVGLHPRRNHRPPRHTSKCAPAHRQERRDSGGSAPAPPTRNTSGAVTGSTADRPPPRDATAPVRLQAELLLAASPPPRPCSARPIGGGAGDLSRGRERLDANSRRQGCWRHRGRSSARLTTATVWLRMLGLLYFTAVRASMILDNCTRTSALAVRRPSEPKSRPHSLGPSVRVQDQRGCWSGTLLLCGFRVARCCQRELSTHALPRLDGPAGVATCCSRWRDRWTAASG